jgi:hypothetical protein
MNNTINRDIAVWKETWENVHRKCWDVTWSNVEELVWSRVSVLNQDVDIAVTFNVRDHVLDTCFKVYYKTLYCKELDSSLKKIDRNK